MLQVQAESRVSRVSQTGRWQRRAIGPSTAADAKLCVLSGPCIKIASGEADATGRAKVKSFKETVSKAQQIYTPWSPTRGCFNGSKLNVFLSLWHKMSRSTEHAFQQNQTTLDPGSMCTMKGAPERSSTQKTLLEERDILHDYLDSY